MSESVQQRNCPHCEGRLQSFEVPNEAGCDELFQLACFNDDCPYYREGWDWMWSQYAVKASYRHRVDVATGKASPIPVWTPEALVKRVVSGPHSQ